MTQRARAEMRDGYNDATELPLLVLALAMIPLLLAPVVWDLDDGPHDAIAVAEWFIWAVFAADYLAGLWLADNRSRYVRREWPKLLIVVLPFLRPLRVLRSARALRLLRLTRLAMFFGEVGQSVRQILFRHQLHYVLLAVLAVVVGAASIMAVIESPPEGNIDGFGDALWWASTTVTTVGYGDRFPVTPAGRGLAVFLMVTGIAFFGVLTANLAAFLLERSGPPPADPVQIKLDAILVRLERMERAR